MFFTYTSDSRYTRGSAAHHSLNNLYNNQCSLNNLYKLWPTRYLGLRDVHLQDQPVEDTAVRVVLRVWWPVYQRLLAVWILLAFDEEHVAHVDGLDFLSVENDLIVGTAVCLLPEVHVGVARVFRPFKTCVAHDCTAHVIIGMPSNAALVQDFQFELELAIGADGAEGASEGTCGCCAGIWI